MMFPFDSAVAIRIIAPTCDSPVSACHLVQVLPCR